MLVEEAAEALDALRAEYAARRTASNCARWPEGSRSPWPTTAPSDVRRFTGAEKPDELTPALLETLAVVAYSSP